MDEGTAKKGIDWLIEASGRSRQLVVNLMGGEPLIRFDLIQRIVPYGKLRARQHGKSLHFGCTTNCTLVTEEIVSFWRRFGMGFHCSIDGVPEVQNSNRPLLSGGASARAVEQAVSMILAYRPEVMARATITPRSVPWLYESAKYFAKLGFRSMTFKVAANSEWRDADFETLRREYERIGEFYIDQLTTGKAVSIDELAKGIRALRSTAPNKKFPCGAGRGMVLIDPRGDIWPCHRFGPHQCGGAFRLGKLGGQFNDRLRSVFLNYDMLDDAKVACNRCRAAATCRSWCYAECVDSTHSLYDPGPVHCRAAAIVHDEILHVHDALRSHHADVLQRIAKAGISRL